MIDFIAVYIVVPNLITRLEGTQYTNKYMIDLCQSSRVIDVKTYLYVCIGVVKRTPAKVPDITYNLLYNLL